MTLLFSASLLVVPTFYFMAMLMTWACVRDSTQRNVAILAMTTVPVAMFGAAAYRVWAVVQAENSFNEQCQVPSTPVVNARVNNVESLLINVRTPSGKATPAERHALAVFPMEEGTRMLLGGALAYQKVERTTRPGFYQSVDGSNTTRPAESKSAASRYVLEWRSAESLSDFTTAGVMVVLDASDGRVLAEQRTRFFESPPVALFGTTTFSFNLYGAQRITCPSALQLAHFVKSVARPAIGAGG